MILNNAPVHEAIVSNVNEIGEFRIRNSAKAFNILSSGLYANKIRAVIRELSCNAYDSHVAAGKKDVPFDVHLPNSLEPHFSVRDYGVGLSNSQVTQIYTTYFESTKTGSNDFVGALGLGSKSPFSYTDNFTVTAIKDGVKGIYTAFINNAGVPSIALMMEEKTDEPNGVEVKFSVNNSTDYAKFSSEASVVYTHFTPTPIVSGRADYKVNVVNYETRDIIPGVHSIKARGYKIGSFAVMGNIEYPINVPGNHSELQDLAHLLDCHLEIHFNIGEVDFQASREGLSYIPLTITAIADKLRLLKKSLNTVLAKEANAITNLWDRAFFLADKSRVTLWRTAATDYIKSAKIPLISDESKAIPLNTKEIAKKYNISLRGLKYNDYHNTVSLLKPDITTQYNTLPSAGQLAEEYWNIPINRNTKFVINDTTAGGVDRTRYHYRQTRSDNPAFVYILEATDKTKAMDTKGFLKSIHNPPANFIAQLSSLKQKKSTAATSKTATILKLQKVVNNYVRSSTDVAWKEVSDISKFSDKINYYYLPLSGFRFISSKGYTSSKELYSQVKEFPELKVNEIYGVRKADIEKVDKLPNWINLETHISTALTPAIIDDIRLKLLTANLKNIQLFTLDFQKLAKLVNANNDYLKLGLEIAEHTKSPRNAHLVSTLIHTFFPKTTINDTTLFDSYNKKIDAIGARYPLLTSRNLSYLDIKDIADYVNAIDKYKK